MSLVFPKTNVPSRDTRQLLPTVQLAANNAIKECVKRGIKIFVTQTWRSSEYQHELFKQGKTKLDGGKGMHEFRVALDIATNVKGNLYHEPTLKAAAAIFKKYGFTWGGDWTSFVDKPHFQFCTVPEQDKIRSLKTPDAIENYLKARKK